MSVWVGWGAGSGCAAKATREGTHIGQGLHTCPLCLMPAPRLLRRIRNIPNKYSQEQMVSILRNAGFE